MADKRMKTVGFPGKAAFSPGRDWMRMDPAKAQGAQTRQFLEDRYATRQERNFDTMGLGTIATGLDLAGGIPQYLVGEAAAAAGVDPVGLLMSGAEAVGARPEYGLAAGGLLLGSRALRKAAKGAANEAKLRRMERSAAKLGGVPAPVAQVAKYTTQLETEKMLTSPQSLRGVERLLEVLPTAERIAAGMKAGEAKRGWYEASAKAIVDTFGMDAPRFAALLAATSPQTSVESNLLNTVNIWTNWERAGRPTDERSIKAIMGRSVQGNKGEDSVLSAWINNTITALTTSDPRQITLSGPKVNSFMLNLRGDVEKVTLDAWMANGLGVAQDAFSGSPTKLQKAAGDPGISAKYAAVSGRVREAAKIAGMTPAEGQETFWSIAMPMYEEAKRRGVSAQELLQRGWLTNRMVRGTPDFATIFKGTSGSESDKKVREVLERGGYGDRIDAMQPHQWPDIPMDSAPNLSSADQRHLEQLAKILDDTAGLRQQERTAMVVPDARPQYITAHSMLETIPGAKSGVGDTPGVSADILYAPDNKKKTYHSQQMSALTDQRGRDRLTNAVFPGRTTEAMNAQGAWLGPEGMEWNPASGTAVTNLPVRWDKTGTPDLTPQDKKALTAIYRTQGLLYQQHGVGGNAVVPHAGGTSTFTTRPKSASRAELEAAAVADPKTVHVDTGRGVAGLDVGEGSTPVTEAKMRFLTSTVGAPTGTKKKPIPAETYQGRNVGPFVSNEDVYKNAPIGSGLLTTQLLDEYDQLPAWQRRALDAEARGVATILHQDDPGAYLRRDTNLFRKTLAQGGYEGLRQGVLNKIGLPAGLLAIGYGWGQGQNPDE